SCCPRRSLPASLRTARRLPLPALAKVRHQRGHQRDDDDADHDPRQVVLDPRDIPEEETRVGERAHPCRGAHDVVAEELAISHLPRGGEEGGEGAHDRQKAADDDGEAAVFFVEAMRALEVLRLEPAPEPGFMRLMESLGTDVMADRIVDRVTEDRGGEERQY